MKPIHNPTPYANISSNFYLWNLRDHLLRKKDFQITSQITTPNNPNWLTLTIAINNLKNTLKQVTLSQAQIPRNKLNLVTF
jgi:hypothetical protein